MYEIWKHYIDRAGITDLDLIQGFEILKVDIHGGDIYLWELHEANLKETVKVKVKAVGTGWNIDHKRRDFVYLDSVQDGEFAWHVFMLKGGGS